jgi:nicotinamidase-related amidase
MNKENSKLVVVDMQEGFRYQELEAIIAEIRLAMDIFAGSVLFAKFINREDSLFHTQLNWEKMRDSSDTKLFSQFKDYEDSSFEHYTYSILNDDLRAIIEREGISRIYLAGVYTDVSIIGSAMDLFDEGIETFVISDACASLHGNRNHETAIESLTHILGDDHIISTDNL